MRNPNPQLNSGLLRAFKKIFLSAFVVFSFIGYALNKPANQAAQVVPPTGNQADPPQNNIQQNTQPTVAQPAATVPAAPTDTAFPQQVIVPTQTPAAPTTTAPAAPVQQANNSGQYKDGTFNGPEVDAIYGLVQVQVVIQKGKISNVQFLEYPNDRRTSVRINSFAVPYLQQEAVQVQSANVNLITGATLTSEAFQMSLQAALNQAKGSL
jgi:uncharacterized protein with FMN-binding domain